MVNSASPYRTLKDLLDAARAKPAELSIASVGPHTTQHIAIERLKRLAGVNITYVPFTGGTPAINALVGQHVTAALQNYIEVSGQLSAGTLRALASATAQADRAAARSAHDRGAGLQGFRRRGLVRAGGAGEDAAGDGGAARRLVQPRAGGAGGQRPSSRPRRSIRTRDAARRSRRISGVSPSGSRALIRELNIKGE